MLKLTFSSFLEVKHSKPLFCKILGKLSKGKAEVESKLNASEFISIGLWYGVSFVWDTDESEESELEI